MKRRNFIQTSLAAATIAALPQTPLMADDNKTQEFYELRTYTLKPGSDGKALHDFLREAAIPALNRLGSKPIGVFTPRDATETPLVYVLIPHSSLEAFANVLPRLAEDQAFLEAGNDYLNLPATDAAFARFESSLLHAFSAIPKIELPAYSVEKKPRLFELRTYESHNEVAALKKIEMFNEGETEIMRRAGLAPVFYGATIIGQRLPNLTYMLSAENEDAHKAHWGNFRNDAEWKRISALPEYANAKIVSKISNVFLVPTDYSQI